MPEVSGAESLLLPAVARKDSSDNNASDSSKKVAKAARAGATSNASKSEGRSSGFPMALAGIIIAGSALVFFAWQGRDVAALQPTFGDHWHAPYGIWDCTANDGDGAFQAPIQDPQTSNAGIHTHSDGVVHIHPFSSVATGSGATLGTFLEATEAQFEDDIALTFANRPELTEEGVTCGGEEAVLQIHRFPLDATEPSEVITENLDDYRFGGDLEGFVIALAPLGAEIPVPPADAVATATAASPSVLRTDGLNDLGATGGAIGFDEDGNLLDPDGAPILDAEGEPITRADLEADIETELGDGDDG